MVNDSSDDYELMPQHELEDLRHEVYSLKKGSLVDGDKARVLIESMDRLTISINRLITILDDAQKDIILEYQDAKPAEKLNQLLEQNVIIAKAIVAISDNISSNSQGNAAPAVPSYAPAQNPAPARNTFQASPEQLQSMQGMVSMPSQNAPMNNPRTIIPLSNDPFMNANHPANQGMQYGQQMQPNMQMNNMQMNGQMQMGNLPSMNQQMQPMNDLPPMDEMPPLEGQMPAKKKFFGLM